MGGRTAEADVGARRAPLSVSTGRLERVRRPEPRRAPSPDGAAAGRTRTDPLRADPEVYASAGRFPKSCVVRPPLLRCLPPPCLPNASFARSADATAAPLARHSGRFRALERHKTSPHSNAAAADVPPLEVRGGFRALKRHKTSPHSNAAAAGLPPLEVRGSFMALERHKTSHTPTQRQPGYPHSRFGKASGR